MLLKRFKCQKCNERFEEEVFDREDPKERTEPGYPIRCPRCHSSLLEVLQILERRNRRAS